MRKETEEVAREAVVKHADARAPGSFRRCEPGRWPLSWQQHCAAFCLSPGPESRLLGLPTVHQAVLDAALLAELAPFVQSGGSVRRLRLRAAPIHSPPRAKMTSGLVDPSRVVVGIQGPMLVRYAANSRPRLGRLPSLALAARRSHGPSARAEPPYLPPVRPPGRKTGLRRATAGTKVRRRDPRCGRSRSCRRADPRHPTPERSAGTHPGC
jgi:hypothetical protein